MRDATDRCGAAPPLRGSGACRRRVTVDQAVAAALAHNANVASARLEVEKAQTRVDAARTKRLPSLNLDAMGGEALSNLSIEVRDGAGETTRVDLARTFNLFAVVRLTQPITQLHAINLGVKMQETSMAADRERERAARLAVTREVKCAYFAVLAAEAYAGALKDAVTAWEEVEREMNVRRLAEGGARSGSPRRRCAPRRYATGRAVGGALARHRQRPADVSRRTGD